MTRNFHKHATLKFWFKKKAKIWFGSKIITLSNYHLYWSLERDKIKIKVSHSLYSQRASFSLPLQPFHWKSIPNCGVVSFKKKNRFERFYLRKKKAKRAPDSTSPIYHSAISFPASFRALNTRRVGPFEYWIFLSTRAFF